jgi:hypothetical protein
MIKSRRMRWAGYVACMGGVITGFGYALGDQGIGIWFLAGARELPLLHNILTALGSIQLITRLRLVLRLRTVEPYFYFP